MSESEPKGCLAVILGLFGMRLAGPAEAESDEGSGEPEGDLPYRLRDDFLSAAEFSFYRVLVNALGNRAVVSTKVRLADVFFVARSKTFHRHQNKIDRKHVDFLLCDPVTMKPRCGIELDDSSHARRDRQERDEFVDEVFRVAGLPLVRVPARAAYNPAELLAVVEPHLNANPVAQAVPPTESSTDTPTCPKCCVPMVKRVASKGPNAGQSFFGCPNYPRCRETA